MTGMVGEPAQLKTYEPDNSLKKGYWRMFAEIVSEISRNRWLTYQLFKRDFFALYKQSFVGVWWAIILPIVSVGTFSILSRSGILSVGALNVPYPLFAVLGIAFWQLFSTGLVASSGSLVKAGSMINKINFSKKSLVIASMGQAVVSFLIQIAFACLLFAYYGIVPSAAILLVPVLVLPLLLLSLGIGFLLAVLNGVIHDIGNAISTLMTFLMFLTPVLYAKPISGMFEQITRFNPLYYLIAVPRSLVLQGATTEWTGFAISTFVSVIVFIVCLVVFHLTETRVAERI